MTGEQVQPISDEDCWCEGSWDHTGSCPCTAPLLKGASGE